MDFAGLASCFWSFSSSATHFFRNSLFYNGLVNRADSGDFRAGKATSSAINAFYVNHAELCDLLIFSEMSRSFGPSAKCCSSLMFIRCFGGSFSRNLGNGVNHVKIAIIPHFR